MLFQNKATNKDNSLDFTSMIDVVFLLLIFFICTASLQLPESEIKTAVAGQSVAVPEFPPVRIDISSINGDFLVKCDKMPCLDENQLREQIAARSAIADIAVVFYIDDKVAFDDVVRVMDICRQGGLKRLAIPIDGL